MQIIFDTNFLIYLVKYKLFFKLEDHYSHAKWIVPIQVINELKHLKEKVALQIIEKYYYEGKIEKPDLSEGHTDEIIVEYARLLKKKLKEKKKEEKIKVATMDKKLIDKLKKAKIGIIIIRQKNFFEEF